MPKKKSKEGLNVKKENFSEWYTQILYKAEIVDVRFEAAAQSPADPTKSAKPGGVSRND